MTISITRNLDGSLTLATVEANRRISHRYVGYTRREATAAFRIYVKEQTR